MAKQGSIFKFLKPIDQLTPEELARASAVEEYSLKIYPCFVHYIPSFQSQYVFLVVFYSNERAKIKFKFIVY